MPDVPEVKLGGRPREFKYTHAERDLLEDRFDKGLLELVNEDILPRDAAGRFTGGGRWRVQLAFLFAGLRHYGKAVTESKVKAWLETHLAHDGNMMEILNVAVVALFQSGVLGFSVKPPDEEEPEEGKG